MAPTKQPPGRTRPDPQSAVISWRRESLERAGFDPERAERIAKSDADLYQAISMIERGCTPELAEQILL